MPNCSVCKVAAPFHELADGKCLKCLAAELTRSKDPANDPDMVWRDDLGWLHKNQLDAFTELEKKCAEMRDVLVWCHQGSLCADPATARRQNPDDCPICKVLRKDKP